MLFLFKNEYFKWFDVLLQSNFQSINMPQNVTIRISPSEAANEKVLKQRLATAAKTKPENINAYQIVRRSLDARTESCVGW